MEFLVLSCLAVIAAVLVFWIVVYPALLIVGMVVSAGLGARNGFDINYTGITQTVTKGYRQNL